MHLTPHQDTISALILRTDQYPISPSSQHRPAPLSDCWEDLSSFSSDEDLDDEQRKSNPFLNRDQETTKVTPDEDQTDSRFGTSKKDNRMASSRKLHKKKKQDVSNAYLEALQETRNPDLKHELVNLFPSTKEELETQMMEALRNPARPEDHLGHVNLSLLIATAKLRKGSKSLTERTASIVPRQASTSKGFSTSKSIFYAVTSFKRRSMLRATRRDPFEEAYVSLWSRPILDSTNDDFCITFKDGHNGEPSSPTVSTDSHHTPRVQKKTSADLVQYDELLGDLMQQSKSTKDSDDAIWIRVNERVKEWG